MIDNELTKRMVAFLEATEVTEDDIRSAADILFKLNHNRFLCELIKKRPQRYVDKLTHELNRYLKPRLDGMTCADVNRMDEEVTPIIRTIVFEKQPEDIPEEEGVTVDDDMPKKKLGKRADHEELPAEIKALWDINAERWKKMKEAFATCQELESSCDRYEYLKILKELYVAYKADMDKYDSWNPDSASAAAADAKEINNARAYISRNRPEYDKLIEAGDNLAADKLRAKIQERVTVLVANKANVSEDLNAWLLDNEFITA